MSKPYTTNSLIGLPLVINKLSQWEANKLNVDIQKKENKITHNCQIFHCYNRRITLR